MSLVSLRIDRCMKLHEGATNSFGAATASPFFVVFHVGLVVGWDQNINPS